MRVLRTLLASLLIVAAGIATLAAVTHGFRAFTADGRVALLSISFDPSHDDPAQLADYQRRSRNRGPGWIAARPTKAGELDALMRSFGVIAIPDGLDGYVHNAAINVVDPAGRLVAILDWNDAAAAERYVRARLQP